jgi:hypothetical protein
MSDKKYIYFLEGSLTEKNYKNPQKKLALSLTLSLKKLALSLTVSLQEKQISTIRNSKSTGKTINLTIPNDVLNLFMI